MTQKVSGFTFVEVLLSILILLMAFVSVGPLFVQSMKASVSSGGQTGCADLAQQQMERLRDADYDELASGGSIESAADGFSEFLDLDGDGRTDYVVAWSISDARAPSPAKRLSSEGIGIRSLTVKCEELRSEQGQVGRQKELLLTTYKTRGLR